MPVPYYCSFVVNFEDRKYGSSNFILLFKDCFSFQGFLEFHVNLRIGCSISVKKIVGILIEILLYLYIALGSNDILTMLSLPVHEHGCLSIYLGLLNLSNVL